MAQAENKWTPTLEHDVADLLDELIGSQLAREIDAGANGSGMIAEMMVNHFGFSFDEANEIIWGEDWEDEQ